MLLQIHVCIWIFMYLFLIQLGEKKNGLEENFFIFFNFILAFFFLGKCQGFVHMHARRRRLWRLVSVLRLFAMLLPCLCRRAGQLKAQSSLEKKKKEMATFSHLKEQKKDDLILFPVSKLKQEYFEKVFFFLS